MKKVAATNYIKRTTSYEFHVHDYEQSFKSIFLFVLGGTVRSDPISSSQSKHVQPKTSRTSHRGHFFPRRLFPYIIFIDFLVKLYTLNT